MQEQYREDIGHVYNFNIRDGQMARGYSSGWSSDMGEVYEGPYEQHTYHNSTVHQNDRYAYNKEGIEEYDGPGDAYVGNEIYVESSATQAGQIDEDGHLQVDDLFGVQTAILYPQFKGSLDEFAKNPNKTVWKMSRANLDQLKLNTRTHNRSNATEEDRLGDLSKAIIVGARVLNATNTFGKTLGMKCTGMEPKVHTTNGSYSWVFGANSGYQPVKESIYSPQNIFTKYMYRNYDKCDSSSLNNQIRFDMGGEHKASVDTRGFVWSVIMKNADSLEHWNQFADDLYAIDTERRQGLLRNRFVEIPKPIAEEVHKSIKQQLDQIEKSFVDLRTFSCSVEPIDGEDWNQCAGLVGEAAVFDESSKLKLRDHALYKTCTAETALEIKYVLYE